MKKPNFFIIGAPKCGTTSLSCWLREHPDVYLPRIKEPHFFNFDYSGRKYYKLEQYEALFDEATDKHIAVGEATTAYLRSHTAVPAIEAYVELPKYIVMVRNPVEMALSLHNHSLLFNEESEKSFDKAWSLQFTRFYGGDAPPGCPDIQKLWYGERCALGDQLDRLYSRIDSSRIKTIDLDQLAENPKKIWLELLIFLNVDDDQRESFPVENSARRRRGGRLFAGVQAANRTLNRLGIKTRRLGPTEFINRITRKPREVPRVSYEVREMLYQYFEGQGKKASKTTGLNFEHWP